MKLCDFGVSGELIGSQAGTFTGTAYYMAVRALFFCCRPSVYLTISIFSFLKPERMGGLSYTIRADVWSTGLSLLELVQNRFPFPSDLPAIELMMYISASEVAVYSFLSSTHN